MSTGHNLVFLISQPRAGSTLLQKVLGAHSHIHTVSEPWVALHPLMALRQAGMCADYSHSLACEATKEFLRHIPGGEDAYFCGVRRMLHPLYESVLAPSGKPLFLDKTPRYYFVISELRRVFPDARFVFLLRNPLATFASILDTWVKEPYFGGCYAFRTDLLHDVFTALELILSAVESPQPNDTVVHYEKFVQSPATHLAALCERLQIPYEPEMIEYGAKGHTHWVFGDQSTVYAEQRPVAGRAERWQRTLRRDAARNELARSYLQAIGHRTVERLGYDYSSLSDSLAGVDGASNDAQPFLKLAVMVPSYGDLCTFPSQLAFFQGLLRRLGAEG